MNPEQALRAVAGVTQGIAFVDRLVPDDAPARPILRRLLKTLLEIIIEIVLAKLGPTFFSLTQDDESQ